MLHIAQSGWQQLRQHAERAYPEECCGVLLGRAEQQANRVLAVRAVENAAEGARTQSYRIAPETLIHWQRTAREQGLAIVGFYHSHPEQAAQWSQRDWAEAHWTDCSYVITSVRLQGGQPCAQETRSFRLRQQRGEKYFADEEILFHAEAF